MFRELTNNCGMRSNPQENFGDWHIERTQLWEFTEQFSSNVLQRLVKLFTLPIVISLRQLKRKVTRTCTNLLAQTEQMEECVMTMLLQGFILIQILNITTSCARQ